MNKDSIAIFTIFIDGTFFRPINYLQTIIIMYIDIITGLKIPGLYALLTNKTNEDYDNLLEYVTYLFDINSTDILTVTVDFEEALINSVEQYFPNKRILGCYYHYKQSLYRQAQKYNLTNKNNKEDTYDLINNKLGKLPFLKIGNINIFENYIKDIKKKLQTYMMNIWNILKKNGKNIF